MGIWIVLALVALIVWIPQISRKQQEQTSTSASNQNRTNLWTSPLVWYISIFMGLQSMVISWLPDSLKSQGMIHIRQAGQCPSCKWRYFQQPLSYPYWQDE